VIFGQFNAPRPLPLQDTVSLSSLISEMDNDVEMAQHMAQARRELSTSIYADEPESLSSLRLNAGLSQSQLAELVLTSQPHIARIERGQTDPGTDVIARIAHALNLDETRVYCAIRYQITTRGNR
jgi:ribosome-binding protein aMBF1 (putative translation factor)